MTIKLPLRWAAIALLGVTSALADPVLDQSQTAFNVGLPFDFGQEPNYPVGQSFTAGLSGVLTDISVMSNGQIKSSGNLSIEIRAGNGTGGSLLGSLTTAYSTNTYDFTNNWYLVGIDVSALVINLVSGYQYTFLITNVTGSDFPYRGILANTHDPYAGGRAYSGPGYGEYVAPWDLEFQTFVDQNPTAPSVPDSGSTLLLLAAGCGLMVKFRRRR